MWDHKFGEMEDPFKYEKSFEFGEIKYRYKPEHLHIPGAKDDSSKPRLDLVLGEFPDALWEVGKVGTYGANKYTDSGWKEVENGIERYSNALLRHYLRYKMGEKVDLESGEHHLSHLAWNSLAILQLYIDKKNSRRD